MSISRSMSQYTIPYVASMPPYMDSHYIHPVQAPMMESLPPQEMSRSSPPQPNVPPSPASSSGEGRVSKARKGKRVHACEYPGCPKIFTRAEHRRRHELSHKAKKTYVCTYEGCEKAFHRSDYLTQHMARHESGSPKAKSPSVRSNSTSSPVLPGFHSPATNASTGTTSSAEQSIMACTGCLNCNHQPQNCAPNSMYHYASGMHPSPNVQMLSPQSVTSPLSPGFDTAIDHYLRSVLRPEAFITPHHSQEPMNNSFWTANIDPSLPQVNHTTFQHPTSYPWTSSAEDLASSIPAIHHLTDNAPRPDHDTS